MRGVHGPRAHSCIGSDVPPAWHVSRRARSLRWLRPQPLPSPPSYNVPCSHSTPQACQLRHHPSPILQQALILALVLVPSNFLPSVSIPQPLSSNPTATLPIACTTQPRHPPSCHPPLPFPSSPQLLASRSPSSMPAPPTSVPSVSHKAAAFVSPSSSSTHLPQLLTSRSPSSTPAPAPPASAPSQPRRCP